MKALGRPTLRGLAAGIGLAGAEAIVTARAHAAPAPRPADVVLEWRETAGCATSSEARAALVAMTGHVVAAEGTEPSFTVRVEFEPGDGEWVARVRLLQADRTTLGVRELRTRASSCRALDRSVTLTVGLLIDLEVERRETERKDAERVAVPQASPPPPAPRRFQVPPDAPPSRTPDWAVSAGAFVSATVGLLPALAEGAGLGARIVPPRSLPTITASALYVPPHEAFVGTPGLTMRAWYATLGACPLVARGSRLRWSGCLAVAGGSATASGLSLQTTRTSSPTLFGAVASTSLDVLVAAPFSVGAFLDVFALGEHRFFATVSGRRVELFETWPVVPTLGLALRASSGP